MKEFAQKIASLLNWDCSVSAVPETDSTNKQVRRLAEQGAPEGTVLFAETQSAGRGRLGRSFFSPGGSGLYFSVLLRPCKPTDGFKITVAAGVAVARAVEDVLGLSLQIKWVNDLYFNNKKVCGILAEGAVDASGRMDWCVLGIGINVYAPAEGFGELNSIAGALLEGAPDQALRARLAAAVLNHFYAIYKSSEDSSVLEEYRSRSFLQGKTVIAVRGTQRFSAQVVGIGAKGELLLLRENGEEVAFASGEVQLEDYR